MYVMDNRYVEDYQIITLQLLVRRNFYRNAEVMNKASWLID